MRCRLSIPFNYAFQPDGTLARDVPYFDNRAIGGGVFGGLSATGLENAMLLPGLERFNGNIFLNGNISPAFKPFVEAGYVRINAQQRSSQPTFISSTLNPVFSTSNPFLSAQARGLLQQFPATVSTLTCQARTGTSQCFQIQRFTTISARARKTTSATRTAWSSARAVNCRAAAT